MSTEAITIKVDSEAASAFKNAPAEEQRKMEALVSLWLKEIAGADARPLKEVMNEIGREAQRRGMTPEILDSLLKDEVAELPEGEVVTTIKDDSNGKVWKHGNL